MVLELIKQRYSVRKFKPDMPSEESIRNILEAGRLAPSWMNVQPWKFIVIKNQTTKEVLSKLSNGQSHIKQAPIIIACCGDLSCWDNEKFKKLVLSRPGITQDVANMLLTNPLYNPSLACNEAVLIRTVEAVTYATAYMTIEAYNQGLGACIIGAMGNEITDALQDVYSVAREELGLDENTILINLLTIGYNSIESIPVKSRKNYEEIVFQEKIIYSA